MNTLYNYNITVQKTDIICIEIPCRTEPSRGVVLETEPLAPAFLIQLIYTICLSLHHSIIEFFYFSSNPKPGAEDQQNQRRRQRGCARVSQVASASMAASTASAAPSYMYAAATSDAPCDAS